MYLRLLILFVFITGFSVNVSAQKDTLDRFYGGRLKSYRDHLNIRLNANSRVDGFSVESNPRPVEIVPNTEVRTELSVNYRFISVSAGVSPRFFNSNRDDLLKGTTRSKRVNINVNMDHLMQQFSYTRTKGYYLQNTADYLPNWNKDSAYIQFPNLQYSGFYGSTGWKWNKYFSFNAITTQTEEQTCNTGTFLPSLSYHIYFLDDKTPLTTSNSSQRSGNVELLLNAGYYFTWSMGSGLYASLGASSGAGIISTRLTTRRFDAEWVTQRKNFIWRIEGLCSLGYSSDRYFGGAQLFLNGQRYAQTGSSNVTRSNTLSWQLYGGIRLHAPRKLRKLLDALEEKKERVIRRSK
jgi:hypothetical protein